MPKFLYYPVRPFAINQAFGVNGAYYQQNGINIKGHNGIDLKAYHGQPVYAAHDGIAYFETDGNQGEGVVIVGSEAIPYDIVTCQFTTNLLKPKVNFKTVYWHLCDEFKDPQCVSPVLIYQRAYKGAGMPVKAGDLIGYADNTGLSTGDHCHWALKPIKNGSSGGLDATDDGIGAWENVSPANGYLGAIDQMPYLNGYYADNAQSVLLKYSTLVGVLTGLWNLIKLKKTS